MEPEKKDLPVVQSEDGSLRFADNPVGRRLRNLGIITSVGTTAILLGATVLGLPTGLVVGLSLTFFCLMIRLGIRTIR